MWLLIVGIFGMLASTVLFPLLATFFRFFRSPRKQVPPNTKTNTDSGADGYSFRFCIPAHNEESVVRETVESISQAIAFAQERFPQLKVRILVGADGCRDQTARRAQDAGAEVLEILRNQGKWATLMQLVNLPGEETWLGFVDAGFRLPQNSVLLHLEKLEGQNVGDENVSDQIVGSALAYQPKNASRLEKLHWAFEALLKSLETKAGGPVAVSGAGCFYRKRELLSALADYSNFRFTNDDVAIPLAIRLKFPGMKIEYISAAETGRSDDAGLNSLRKNKKSPAYLRAVAANRATPEVALRRSSELSRRQRIVRGNVQWIQIFAWPLVKSLFRAPEVFCLASRRFFRLFWGIWITALLSGMMQLLSREQRAYGLLSLAVVILILNMSSRGFQKLIAAYIASLIAPLEFLRSQEQITWS